MDGFCGNLSRVDLGGESRADGFFDGLRCDVVFLVIGDLFFASAIGLVDGALHGGGHLVGVENDFCVHVSGGSANHLDERGFAAEEAFLVGVEDAAERDFGEVESFAQEVDTDEDVEFAGAQAIDDFDAFEGVDFAVEVFAEQSFFLEVGGEVFGEPFGEGGDEDAFACGGALDGALEQVGDLSSCRQDVDGGIDESCGADDLLDNFAFCFFEFVGSGGGGEEDDARPEVFEFLEAEWSVVEARRQAEAMLDEGGFSTSVAGVHGSDLWDADVGFVDDEEEVVGEVIDEGVGS